MRNQKANQVLEQPPSHTTITGFPQNPTSHNLHQIWPKFTSIWSFSDVVQSANTTPSFSRHFCWQKRNSITSTLIIEDLKESCTTKNNIDQNLLTVLHKSTIHMNIVFDKKCCLWQKKRTNVAKKEQKWFQVHSVWHKRTTIFCHLH